MRNFAHLKLNTINSFGCACLCACMHYKQELTFFVILRSPLHKKKFYKTGMSVFSSPICPLPATLDFHYPSFLSLFWIKIGNQTKILKESKAIYKSFIRSCLFDFIPSFISLINSFIILFKGGQKIFINKFKKKMKKKMKLESRPETLIAETVRGRTEKDEKKAILFKKMLYVKITARFAGFC